MWCDCRFTKPSHCFAVSSSRARLKRRYCLKCTMPKEVLINVGAGETRVAVVEDGRLQELFLERTVGLDDGGVKKKGVGRGGHSIVGNIILGRVQRVLPGMQAA